MPLFPTLEIRDITISSDVHTGSYYAHQKYTIDTQSYTTLLSVGDNLQITRSYTIKVPGKQETDLLDIANAAGSIQLSNRTWQGSRTCCSQEPYSATFL